MLLTVCVFFLFCFFVKSLLETTVEKALLIYTLDHLHNTLTGASWPATKLLAYSFCADVNATGGLELQSYQVSLLATFTHYAPQHSIAPLYDFIWFTIY